MPPKSKRQRHSSAVKSVRSENAGEYQYLHLEDVYKDGPRDSNIDLVSKLDVHAIGNLFELLKMSCGSQNLSVLAYMIMRYMGRSGRSTEFSYRYRGLSVSSCSQTSEYICIW